MDALEDTHLALQGFLHSEPPSDLGLKYLWIYGAFQALVIQQDAFLSIAETLGKSSTISDLPLEVRNIREDRNNIVGHPIEREGGPLESKGASHFLVQSELHSHFIKVARFRPQPAVVEYFNVDLSQLIPNQEQSLAQVLSQWLSEGDAH